MIRSTWMTSSAAAKAYFAQADYYAASPGDWLGKGAALLGLEPGANQMHFWSLADNLHPQTGEKLRPRAKDGDRVGMDITFNAVKSVSLARELAYGGDARIEDAHREAVAYTVGLIERDMQGRVRMGGANDNRTTGNLVAYRVTHRDTRINADDQMPDPQLHDHVFVFNTTFDPVEKKWKAAELGQVKHDLPYYEAVYQNRLASHLKTLGYGVERKGKAFEIAGIDRPLIDKFSRRSRYINAVTEKLGVVRPESKAKLGATTRLGKTKETAEDLQGYYVSRLTDDEKQQLNSLLGRPSSEKTPEDAVAYALSHEFERRSVVDERKVYETALRHGVGSVTPEEVQAEAKRQGLLVRDGNSTTKAVLAEEQKIIAFARQGKGACRPMATALAPGHDFRTNSASTRRGPGGAIAADTATLSPDQQAMVSHVLTSPDRLILVVGDAGTGKSWAVKHAFERINRPIDILAPGAEASRGVLRRDGFSTADTVTAFLNSPQRQARVKDGVVWVDEAGQLPTRDLSHLVDVAREQNARLVLQGDPKQHRSVARDGDMLRTLETHARLPVARLVDIKRQRGDYRKAVESLRDGKAVEGFDRLDALGWVKRTDSHDGLVADYLGALDAKKEVLAIAPTHAEADAVTAAIRDALKARGTVHGEEHILSALTPLHWTDAQKGDLEQYDGSETIQFHRNSGTFKAGDRIAVAAFTPKMRLGPASTYSVFRPTQLALAAGDRIRISSNGWDSTKKHRLDNGAQYAVAGFEKGGVRLTNGWVVPTDFAHLTHGYVTTSHASQGKTVDRVFIAMGGASLGAVSKEQLYVSASRGRERAAIYTDLPLQELRGAIQKADSRRSATAVFRPRRQDWWMFRRAKEAWQTLREKTIRAIQEKTRERMYSHGR